MKKILVFFAAVVVIFYFASSVSAANSITSRLKGKLLLQVQDKGRIWYVDPVGLQKHEVTFANALSLFQKLALGITNADLSRIPVGPGEINTVEPAEADVNLVNRLKGRILLQVESYGEAWYVNPADGRRYYLADGQAALTHLSSWRVVVEQ